MNYLNKTATKTFNKLIAGLSQPGDARSINNKPGIYMKVSVDYTDEWPIPSKLRFYAVAHRFEQNGDLCPDPDVEFCVTPEGQVFPTAIDQSFPGYQRCVNFHPDTSEISTWRPRAQKDLTSFCNQWMRNIAQQQEI